MSVTVPLVTFDPVDEVSRSAKELEMDETKPDLDQQNSHNIRFANFTQVSEYYRSRLDSLFKK